MSDMGLSEEDLNKKYDSFQRLYERGQCFTVVVRCNELINAGIDSPEVWALRGKASRELNQFAEAIYSFKRVIQRNPNDIDAYIQLGETFATQRDFGRAAVCFDEAKKRTESEDIKKNLVQRLQVNAERAREQINREKQGGKQAWIRSHLYSKLDFSGRDDILNRYEAGEKLSSIAYAYSQSLQYQVSAKEVRNAVILSYIEEGSSDKAYEFAKQHMQSEPDEYLHNLLLRSMLTVTFDVKQEFSIESKRWGKLWAKHKRSGVKKFELDKEIKGKGDIHVGLLTDYAFTVFGRIFFNSLARCLADTGLKVTFYNLDPNHYSDQAKNYSVKNVASMPVEAIHNVIVDDRVTILIDLNGRLRDEYTLDLFTKRSAPFQIMYFCLAGTTGIEDFDFIIADSTRLPAEDEPLFVEEVIRLPCGGVSGFEFERDVPVSSAPCLENDYITFGSFNAPFKYNDALIKDWAAIVKSVPNSRIYIKCLDMARNRVQQRLLDIFKAAGIEKERIRLEGSSWLPYMRACYKDVDIALDTFPHHGGSSNKHAVWQGVPVLTQMGNEWRSRLTPGMMERLGHSEFVTHSRQEYIERAIELAQSPQHLDDTRFDIERKLLNCVNFRPDIICNELSDEFLRICREYGVVKPG